jgi:uncharacterized Zn finger protein (UPF0148 family)
MAEVKCGNCGGPVTGEPGAMACPYCGTRVDIPLVAAPGRSEAEDDDRARAERERARRHDSYEEDDESERTSSSSSSSAPIIFAVMAVVLVVFVSAFFAATRSKKKTSTKDELKKTSVAVTAPATTTSKKTPSLPYAENVPLSSCRCSFGDGQSTPLVTITLRAAPLTDPSRAFDLAIRTQSGFVSTSGSSVLSMNSASALSPNDAGALPAHLGVACDTGAYVLVADRTATAWSSVDASSKWTTALPATMTDGADASAPFPPKGAGFAPYCTALQTTNGNVTLSLANGRKATLSLKDGKLR